MEFPAAHYIHKPLADQKTGEVVVPFCYEARSFIARQRGLLGQTYLPLGEGLLLGEPLVHMIGMKIELELLFLDKRGKIVSIYHARPGFRFYGSLKARKTLELPVGSIMDLGLHLGQTLVSASSLA